MSKQKISIQFKPEFELKLKRLRIKGKFLNELKDYINRSLTTRKPNYAGEIQMHGKAVKVKTHRNIDSAIILNKKEYWRQFIVWAFDWEETKDGYQYWSDILKK